MLPTGGGLIDGAVALLAGARFVRLRSTQTAPSGSPSAIDQAPDGNSEVEVNQRTRTKSSRHQRRPLTLAAALGLLCGGAAQAESVPAAAPLEEVGAVALLAKQASPELVVDLDDRAGAERVKELAARLGVRLLPASRHSGKHQLYRAVLDKKAGELGTESVRLRLLTLLKAFRHEPLVEAADVALTFQIPETAPGALTDDADQALRPRPFAAPRALDDSGPERFAPNDPRYRYQWHLDQIRMPEAWVRARGDGVVVAVIDTGVAPVEDLGGTELVPGWNFVDDTADATDDHGHGTHVAGTIAQTTHNGVGVAGVAFGSKIMPIKVLSASGSGSVAGIAEGIYYAADHGANVINMSLGGPFNSQVLAKAVRYAHDHGVVVVCAAGNDGRGRVSYPAANQGALAVAATQFDESTTFYSNWGPQIAIAAPGGNTRVDQNNDGVPDGVLQNTVTPGNIGKHDYLLFMGTSMASPHVAGVAALVMSQGVRDPNAVAAILKKSARRPAQYRGKQDPHYGAGLVDAAAAVRLAQGYGQTAVAAAPAQAPRPATPWLALALGLGLVGLGAAWRRRSAVVGESPTLR